MSGVINTIAEERKEWRKDPLPGFVAKPSKTDDGSLNLLIWDCYIPGRMNTNWQGGMYFLRITFTDDYPSSIPTCKFIPPLFHPNIPSSGIVDLSILDEDTRFTGKILTLKTILTVIQEIIHRPDYKNAVECSAYDVYLKDKKEYVRRIQEEAKKSHEDYILKTKK